MADALAGAQRSWVRPGPLAGLYPQRPEGLAPWQDAASRALTQGIARAWEAVRSPPLRRRGLLDAAGLRIVRQAQQAALALSPKQWQAAGDALRLELAGTQARAARAAVHARALGFVAAASVRTLGRDPFETQLRCAQALLDGHLAEMATGEGKTLAVALAAAVIGLSGAPVHLMTANDYLAERDAQAFEPLARALGLRHSVVLGSTPAELRARAYAADVTFCTAREVAFDHLRDRQTLGVAGPAGRGSDLQRRAVALAASADATGPGTAPLLLRGLAVALVDEADSLMIDEATMPLVLAESVDEPGQRAACFQALAIARTLVPGRDVRLDAATHSVTWSGPGRERWQAQVDAVDGAWLNEQHARELADAALVALHLLHPLEHYLVDDGRVQLLDAVTGRLAEGRTYTRSLQSLLELKEGCAVTPATRTIAQTSYQRFFARYHHVAGTSGTLRECRRELARVYGCRVVAVPLRAASQRRVEPPRLYASAAARRLAVVAAVSQAVARGQPVLVGVGTLDEAQALSDALGQAGIEHRRLDARNEAQEAAIVAQAGEAGAVTVATRMAGRGTDIALSRQAAAAGGLLVLDCQDSGCARLARQLAGRSGRQGDPGESRQWLAADAPGWRQARTCGLDVLSGLARFDRKDGCAADPMAGSRVGEPIAWALAAVQRRAARQEMRRRRRLLQQDLAWQSRLAFTRLRA